ncbi:MAG: ring-cleaving dioxygenase [Chloroflexota bacterium]|nr:ring-cleaving dioxygenase [Chloroflexota bacterium]
MERIQGLHHITAVAGDPQRNLDFYHHVLGQRLVKTTVNFDDPGTYHLYYADAVGTPGTNITFFPWKHMKRGVRGNGEVAVTSYAIPAGALATWRERLASFDVPVREVERYGVTVLSFSDPDGMGLELEPTDAPGAIQLWSGSGIPDEHAIRGFFGATLFIDSIARLEPLLVGIMGYTRGVQAGNRVRYHAGSSDVGSTLDLVERPGAPMAGFGSGSVHHIAFRTVDDAEQVEYLEALAAAGYSVSPVRDRQYFHSIYFREPNGVLFEVATDAPGFLIDEPIETLGTSLKLPSWFEAQRAAIEARLPKLVIPD